MSFKRIFKKILSLLIIVELLLSPAQTCLASPGGLAAESLYEIASHYYEIGKFDDALHEAGKLLLIDPNNLKALALIEEIKGKQIEAGGLVVEYLLRRAKRHIDIGQQTKALEDLRRVLILEPGFEEARILIKHIKVKQTDTKKPDLLRDQLAVALETMKEIEKHAQKALKAEEEAAVDKVVVAVGAGVIEDKSAKIVEKVKIAEEPMVEEEPKESAELIAEQRIAAISSKLTEMAKLAATVDSLFIEEPVVASAPVVQEARVEVVVEESREEEVRIEEQAAEPIIEEVVEDAKFFEEAESVQGAVKEVENIIRPDLFDDVYDYAQVDVLIVDKEEPVSLVLDNQVSTLEQAGPEPIAQKITKKPKPRITSRELENYQLYPELSITIDGESKPIENLLRKEDDLWISLNEVAKHLGILLFEGTDNNYNLIRSDGLPLDFKVKETQVLVNKGPFLTLGSAILKYADNLMINLDDLGQFLGADVKLNLKDSTLVISSTLASEGEFVTFEAPKPEEPEPRKPQIGKPKIVTKKTGRLIRAPREILPDVRLKFRDSASYSYQHLSGDRKKTNELRIKGELFDDYGFSTSLTWKDRENEDLVRSGPSSVSMYGPDFRANFMNFNVNLSPLRGQSESVEGMAFTKYYGLHSTKFIWAEREVATTGAANVGQVKYHGDLAGVEQKYKSDFIDFKTTLLYTDVHAGESKNEGTTTFPRRNLISFFDTTVHLFDDLDLTSQYALCNYYSDNQKEDLVQDYNWVLGATLDKDRFYFRYNYEFVGDNYASLSNPESYQDYKGWSTQAKFKLNKYLSFSNTLYQSRNNVDNADDAVTTVNKSISFGQGISLPTNTNLRLRWSKRTNRSQTPSDGSTSGSNSRNLMMSMSQKLGTLNLSLGYDISESEDVAAFEGNRISKTFSVAAHKFIHWLDGTSLRARYQRRDNTYKTADPYTDTTHTSSLGFRYTFNPALATYGGARLTCYRKDDATQDSEMLSFNLAADWKVNRDASLGLTFNFSPYELRNGGPGNKESDDWSVFLRFAYGFEITSPSKWAKIYGQVFHDQNGNGQFDAGETVFPDILVEIPKENVIFTDKKGRYVLDEVIPGEKTLKLDQLELPLELSTDGGFTRDITVGSREKKEVNFILIESANIKGRVFIDANGNGTYDLGEDGVEGIRVNLRPKYRFSLTDENGKFAFTFLPAGEYTVSMDAKGLDMAHKLNSSKELKLKLSPGDELTDAYFVVVPRPVDLETF